MDVNPVIIVNSSNGTVHLGLEHDGLIFTHERCNIDDIKDRKIYDDADYFNGDKTLPVSSSKCEICW